MGADSLPDLSERDEYEALLRGEMSSEEWVRRLKGRCQRTQADLRAILEYETTVRQLEGENEALKAEVVALRGERDRAVETRENANAVSVRVEAENERLLVNWSESDALWIAAKAEVAGVRAENERLRELLHEVARRADVPGGFANALVRLRWVHERIINAAPALDEQDQTQ